MILLDPPRRVLLIFLASLIIAVVAVILCAWSPWLPIYGIASWVGGVAFAALTGRR